MNQNEERVLIVRCGHCAVSQQRGAARYNGVRHVGALARMERT